jgi:hypothetical protein
MGGRDAQTRFVSGQGFNAVLRCCRRLVLLLAITVPFLVRAQQALQFDVFPGFADHAREGAWFPVVCEVQNNGPAFSGFIEVSPERGADQKIRLPIDLPTNTRKRVVIPVYAGSRNPEWRVVLRDGRGKVRAEHTTQSFRVLQAEVPLLAAMPRSSASMPVFVDPRDRNADLKPTAVRLQPELFPDNPISLQGMSALYLNTERALALRPPQVDALLTWVESGGQLIIGIDQIGQVSATPWLAQLVPAQLETVQSLPVGPALSQWCLDLQKEWDEADKKGGGNRGATAAFSEKRKLAEDEQFIAKALPVVVAKTDAAFVELASGGTPLILAQNRGKGRVTTLLFDPEREPFYSFNGRPWFWTRLVGAPTSLYAGPELQRYGRQPVEGAIGAVVETKQIRKLSLGWLLLLLVAYVVIIGPVDYFLIRKLRRPMLTWITFPSYVAAFSAVIYVTGYSLRAGKTEWNEITVVDIQPRGDQAVFVGKTFGTIYSPANDRYPVVGERKFAAFRNEAASFFGGGTEGSSEIQLNGNQFAGEVFVPVWVSQMFVMDWVDTGTPPLELVVAPTSRGWDYTIRNKGDHTVGPVRLAIGDSFLDIREITAGGTATGALSRVGSSLSGEIRARASSIQQAMQARRASFNRNPGSTSESPETILLAASFVEELNAMMPQNPQFSPVEGLNLSPLLRRGYAVLVAMDSKPVAGPLVPRFDAAMLQRQTLWRLAVPVKAVP